MKIKRIEHIAIACTKMHKTMAVFENMFGLKMEYEEDLPSAKLSMYPIGETYLEFLEGKDKDSGIRNGLPTRAKASSISVSKSKTSTRRCKNCARRA